MITPLGKPSPPFATEGVGRKLKAFQKIDLSPGETQTAIFILNEEALSFYDTESGKWIAEPGEFEILIGSSSRDIRARSTFTLRV